MKKLAILAALSGIFFGCRVPAALAQNGAAAPAAPPTVEQLTRQLEQQNRTLQDWPNLARFRDANEKVPPPTRGEGRVVFMGDSITEGWGRNGNPFFPGKPYINRGISGQTTPQMLLRFRPDVIALRPRAVVILAGINDIAGNTGPESLETIMGYLTSMVELAQANRIKVVLASATPADRFFWKPGVQPVDTIRALNALIKDYAAKNKIVYLDYYSALVDEKGALKAELAPDGVHPNAAGYAIMAPLAQAAIDKALR